MIAMGWIIVVMVALAWAAALRWGTDSRDNEGWSRPARIGGPLSLRGRPQSARCSSC